MPECYYHGPYGGTRCHRCEVADELKRSRKQAENAERESAAREREQFEESELEAQIRHREAEEAADYRARQLAAHQSELVENAHTIQAKSLCRRAQQLLSAGLMDEAVETARDSLAKDRAYLPAYALLGAAEYDRGKLESAIQAMGKALRLLGTGEWTDEKAYIEVLSRIEGREFPSEIITKLRSLASACSGRATVNFLKWLSSFGWSREVMQLLVVDNLSAKDLVEIAGFLVNGRDLAAGAALISEAVRKLQAQSYVEPSIWLSVTHCAMEVEVNTGEGASRLASFDLAANWPPDFMFKVISELPKCKEWKSIPELKARAVCETLASIVAPILNARESKYLMSARDSVQAPSMLLSWIPAVAARTTAARQRVQVSARQSFRQSTQLWIESSILRGLVILKNKWMISINAHQSIRSYLGEVEHWRAWRLKEGGRFADAALAFSRSRDSFREGGDLRHEQINAYWQAWCLYSCGAWNDAAKGFAEAMQLAKQIGDPAEIGASMYWQAKCLSAAGNPSRDTQRAITLYQEALDAAQAVAATSWVSAESHWSLATLAEESKQSQEALVHFIAAERLYDATGSEYRPASLRKIAKLSCPDKKPGDYTVAITALRTSLELDRQSGDTDGQISDLFELGCCHNPSLNANADWNEAISFLRQANEIAETTNALAWQARCIFHIGCHLEPEENANGDWETAIFHYKRAAELAHLAALDELEAEALNAAGWCYQPAHASFGDWDLVRSWCERALVICRRTQNSAHLATALFNVGKAMARGDCESVTPTIAPLLGRQPSFMQKLMFRQESWSRRHGLREGSHRLRSVLVRCLALGQAWEGRKDGDSCSSASTRDRGSARGRLSARSLISRHQGERLLVL